MKYKEIIRDVSYLNECGMTTENNILRNVDVNIVGHFGNAVCLELMCDNVCPYSCYNNTKNIGMLIKSLVELFDLSEEDGLRMSKIKNIPVRLVFENSSKNHWGEKVVGIGHYMKDKFIMFNEFSQVTEM